MVAGHLLVAGSGNFFVDVFLDSPEYFVDRLKQTTHGADPTVPRCQCTSRCRGNQMAIWQSCVGELEKEGGSPLGKVSVENSGESTAETSLKEKKKRTLSDPMLNVLHLS